ncbi:MAG TPA: acylphosphatase [Cyclobacteriaceae bacterium]
MIQHVTLRISGKVQGVFYRASAKNKADELGVKGFVQNELDGNVYAEAEGTSEQLDDFIEWCAKGPPHARVIDIKSSTGQVQHFEKIEIRR